jgi:hypothetical protein
MNLKENVAWSPSEPLSEETIKCINLALERLEDDEYCKEDLELIEHWSSAGHPLCQLCVGNELLTIGKFEEAYDLIKSAADFGLSDAVNLIESTIEEGKRDGIIGQNPSSEKEDFVKAWPLLFEKNMKYVRDNQR